ncbi:MAG: hypothetical protein WD602_03660 [Actinomycetota bacterium]
MGSVERVFDAVVSVDGDTAAAGDPLFSGVAMQTDGSGRARFSVQILEECTITEQALVVVAPSPDTPLALRRGELLCVSKPGETEEVQIEAGEADVAFLDPVFVVDVEGSTTRVQVDYGFVDVGSRRNSDSRLVGPGGQIFIGPGSMPERPQRFTTGSLDSFERQVVERMRGRLPPEPRGFPSNAGSGTLAQIQESGRLNVGLDERAPGSTSTFAENLFDAVASRWDVGVNIVRMDPDEAQEALAGADLQAFVSPEALPGTSGLSLFDGDREQDWVLLVRSDADFQAALAEVLKVSLNNGEYGDAYFDAFDVVPTYEAVRSLVYPSPGEAGRTQWREVDDESPAEAQVSEISLSVDPQQYSGDCPTELTFTGLIEVAGPGQIEYEFRLDGERYGDGRIEVEHGVEELTGTLTVDQSAAGLMELVVRADRTLISEAEYDVECGETLF